MTKVARLATTVIAVPLAVTTVASYLGAAWWVLGLAAHFRPHLATASAALLAIALIARARPAILLSLALLAANIEPLLPYLGARDGAESQPSVNVRILVLNMHGLETGSAAFRLLIETERPDLLVLSETPPDLASLVEGTDAMPAYRVGEAPRFPFSVTLFSRWPVTRWFTERSRDGIWPVLAADICDIPIWEGCVRLVALHAAQPFGNSRLWQESQLAIAARLAAVAPDHRVLLAGDLNLTPWVPAFSELVRNGGLQDTGPSRGLTATWLSRLPFVGLPIDHLLVSPNIVVHGSHIGGDVGSQHLPIIADLIIPAAKK